MPTYEYVCKSCGDTIEVFQSFSDKPLKPPRVMWRRPPEGVPRSWHRLQRIWLLQHRRRASKSASKSNSEPAPKAKSHPSPRIDRSHRRRSPSLLRAVTNSSAPPTESPFPPEPGAHPYLRRVIWLQTPPWGRWIAAGLIVLGASWVELRPDPMSTIPLRPSTSSPAQKSVTGTASSGEVPAGLLEPRLCLDGVALIDDSRR